MRRPLRGLLIGALSVALAYLAVTNVLLGTTLFRELVNGDPESVYLQYSTGWSVLPGRLHMRDLRLRGKDSNVEWLLTIDDCDATISIPDLFRRRFHVLRARGDGLSFRLRRRLEGAEATRERIAKLPRIDGFEEVPLRPPPEPPITDAEYHLWTIQIEGVEATHLSTVWIDAMHWEAGGGRASGKFYLRPVRLAEVGPVVFETAGARLFIGDERVLDHVEGRVEVRVGAFDPRRVHGTDVLTRVSSRIEASGDVVADPGLAPRGVATTLEGGRARARLVVTDGRLDDGSEAHVELERAGVRSGALRASAHLELEAGVRDRVARWSAHASSVIVEDDRARGAVVKAKRLEVTGSTNELSLAASAFGPGAFVVDLPSATVPDARIIGSWQHAIAVDAGSGTFGGRLRVDGARVEGGGTVGLTGAGFHTPELAFGGALDASVVLRGRLDGELDFSGSWLGLRDVSLPHPRKGPDVPSGSGWWADIDVRRARLAGLGGSPSVEATIDLRCKNARPILDALVSEANLPGWVPRLFTLEGLRAEASGRAAKGTLDLTGLRARGSGFTADATYLDRDDQRRGVVLVTDGPLSAGLETKNGKAHLADRAALDWLSQRLLQGWPERSR